MPNVLNKDSVIGQNYNNVLKVCQNKASDLRLPNREELASITVNSEFWGGLAFTLRQTIGKY